MDGKSSSRLALARLPRRADAFMVPRAIEGAPGQFLVDATWGTIRPIQLAPGVRTVGEVEVVAHIEAGLPLVDSRLPEYYAAGTIPAPSASRTPQRQPESPSSTQTSRRSCSATVPSAQPPRMPSSSCSPRVVRPSSCSTTAAASTTGSRSVCRPLGRTVPERPREASVELPVTSPSRRGTDAALLSSGVRVVLNEMRTRRATAKR
jgi:hypothetical protein